MAPEAKNISITVTNAAGNSIASLAEVDMESVTGDALLVMVAETIGFPAAGLKLMFPSGPTVAAGGFYDTLAATMHKNTDIVGNVLNVTCVLMPAKPFQQKTELMTIPCFHRRKGMPMIHRKLEAMERDGTPVAQLCKAPREETIFKKHEVCGLIEAAFHPGLSSLICAATDACYEHGVGEGTSFPKKCVFEDRTAGTYADLSMCKLWARHLINPSLSHHIMVHMDSAVTVAVIWRLLPDWPGVPQGAGRAIAAGPILEVLFLATAPGLQEGGEASRLQKQLEDAARDLGCAAMCVAAVPKQGINFWKKQAFEVAVPLTTDDVEATSLGEPDTPLGEFLYRNMMLFSDTPLMAKVLDHGS